MAVPYYPWSSKLNYPQNPELYVFLEAIKTADTELLKEILNFNTISDIHFFQYCGETPIGLAFTEGKKEILPLLLKRTDKYFALHIAAKLKKEKLIHFLLENCLFKENFLRFLGLR